MKKTPPMKTLICTVTLMAASLSITQAATLIFSNAASTPQAFATGFADAAGNVASGLVWGVVVDTTGNGFASLDWAPGFNYASGGIVLTSYLTGLPTDDVLFLHTSLTSSRTGDGATASSAVNSISSVTYSNGVSGSDAFAVIWFDRNIGLGGISEGGHKFGLLTQGSVGAPIFVLPSGEADAMDFSGAFLGADPIKTTNLQFVPEPSALLLGLLGLLGLVRRRRF